MQPVATEEFFINADQGRIYARRWQAAPVGEQRPAVVLFHDSLGCVDLWRDFPRQLALALGRPVIAYDRLGFGRSDPNPGTLEPNFVHQEVHQGFAPLRQALGLEQFVALGHSVGGGMALVCAAAHPKSCRALITESAQMFVEDRTLAGIRIAKAGFAEPGQLDRLKKYHGDKAAWVLNAWTETWLSPGFAGWRLDDALRAVRCPVLALHGDLDEYGSLEHPQRMADLADADSVILTQCGHVPHREQPDNVIAHIVRWLG